MALESNNDEVYEETSSTSEEIDKDELIVEDTSTTEESVQVEAAEEDQISAGDPDSGEILTTTAAQPETKFRRIIRLSIRWVIGLLIVFALGFMTAVLLLYIPERDAKSQLNEELIQADAINKSLESDIVQLENEIKEYQSREEELIAEINDLQEELTNSKLHILILSALSDINSARAALMNDDSAESQVYLTNTMETLESLKESVGSEQRDKVISMQNRLDLVLAEIEAEPVVALSDLEVLANSLTLLENTFFAKP
jgi:hypothetical protein